ncbi:MAG: hypothetical protein IAI48_11300 [Candidatus Eremiobacteraeota bacterium]|nr:hypothetical protein [Candidatus Eremiobacteraeota bacterium]
MNFNDAMDRALAQAREMQRQVAAATETAAEQIKPHLEQSLENARELQKTLAKHAAESTEITASQTQSAMSHLNDFMRLGSEALRESAQQSRDVAIKMAEESRKIVENMAAAATRKPD